MIPTIPQPQPSSSIESNEFFQKPIQLDTFRIKRGVPYLFGLYSRFISHVSIGQIYSNSTYKVWADEWPRFQAWESRLNLKIKAIEEQCNKEQSNSKVECLNSCVMAWKLKNKDTEDKCKLLEKKVESLKEGESSLKEQILYKKIVL